MFFNWKRKQHNTLREKTFPLQKEFIVLDSIRFGIRESEMRHQIEGGFTDPYCPTGIIQLDSQEHIDIDALNHEEIVRWRDVADKFCFEMTIPQGACLDNLYLELCLRRYPHRNYNAPVQPTYITASTSQKLYPHTEFLLPFDRKWHLYTFELKEIASSTLGSRISFFINDRKNFLSVDEHYGCSVSYAKLFCTNNKSISPQNLRTKINSYSITDSDVILVMCPVWDVTMPPISIACISSYLRSKGINPFILDFNIESFHKASNEEKILWHGLTGPRWGEPRFVREVLTRFSKRLDNIAEEIAQSNTKVVAFSIYGTNVHMSAAVSERIKKIAPDKTIVFGGPAIPIAAPEGSLGNGWDYLVIGDGEGTLYNIITNNKNSFRGIIPGSEFVTTDLITRRYSEPDLNVLPLLDYEGFHLNRYTDWEKMPAYTSRGCCRRCSYCYDWNYYFPYRYLKGEIAFAHIMNLYQKHNRKYFELSDLLCNGNLESIYTMSKMLREARKDIQWGGFAIIRHDMTDSFFQTLKAGGCDYLRYGFETGSEKLLKEMRRGYTLETAAKILRRTKKAGIKSRINILVGLPGETDETIEETLQFIRSNSAYIDRVDSVNTVAVMPATELMEKRDTFDISIDDEAKTWISSLHNGTRRHEWAQKVIRELEKNGVSCLGGIVEGACEARL